MTPATWFEIRNIEDIDSPALVVYPERVKENIRIIKTMIDDVRRLRPHIKTHKTKEVTLLLLDAGITKFKCATIAEAELLGSCGAPDVLLAYQPVGPKIGRFINLIKTFSSTKFSCLVDNLSSAKNLSFAAVNAEITIHVFIDLNAGMNRTGIIPGEKAVELYETAAKLRGVEVWGFHIYDVHIRLAELKKLK